LVSTQQQQNYAAAAMSPLNRSELERVAAEMQQAARLRRELARAVAHNNVHLRREYSYPTPDGE
jgi:hypothetical protein